MTPREELEYHRRMSDLERRSSAQSNPDDLLSPTIPFGPFDTGIPMPSSVGAYFTAAGRTMDRLKAGAQQPYYAATGQTDKSNALSDVQRENTAAYDPLAKKHPVATFAGEVSPLLFASNPLTMAGLGALEYGTPQERAIRAGFGYAGGKAGQAVSRMFGPESMRGGAKLADEFFDVPTGNKWGIPLTMGQATQNKPAQIAESVVSNLPFGGAVNKARDKSFSEFNRQVARQFGDDAAELTPELFGAAKTRIGGAIGDIAARNTINVDKPLFVGLQNVLARAQTDLTDDEAALVAKQVQQIWGKIDPATGTIPGKSYKAIQSKLGEIAQSRGGTVANVLGDVRTALREAMTRSVVPDDSAAWLKANEQYFNLQQVAHAARRTPGELSPSQLLTEVNASQKASKFGGGNELAELARWGKAKLPDKIPNSGTAQRLFYQKLLTNPLTGIGAIGGAGAGASAMDIDPRYAAFGLTPMIAGRYLAGKPASKLVEEMLKRAGGAGLLGLSSLYTQ